MGEITHSACEICGEQPSLVLGSKEDRIKYYVDSAIRLGAVLGVWQKDNDRIVKAAAGDAVLAVRGTLVSRIMSICAEPEEISTSEGDKQ